MERITAVHLAAAAPELRYWLERVTRRMERLLDNDWQWRKDLRLLQSAWAAVIASKPPYEAVNEIRHEGQREIDFEESA